MQTPPSERSNEVDAIAIAQPDGEDEQPVPPPEVAPESTTEPSKVAFLDHSFLDDSFLG